MGEKKTLTRKGGRLMLRNGAQPVGKKKQVFSDLHQVLNPGFADTNMETFVFITSGR